MKLINFDKQFSNYAAKWMRLNQHKYKNVDEMEMAMPDVYLRWINQRADWLDGETPALFFKKYADADMLISWMSDYVVKRVPLPDQLLERIVELGEDSQEALARICADESAPMEARMCAVNMLREIGSDVLLNEYIRWIGGAREMDELNDNVAESLKQMNEKLVVDGCLAVYADAPVLARECLLDILCHFGRDERILPLALERFHATDNKALMASFLAKLGDERALDALKATLQSNEIHYLDYIEIKNAIQVLGEDVLIDRDFEGDPYYESLKNID
jgi:hypothetical protein